MPRHPATQHLLDQFSDEHLPDPLREITAPLRSIAALMADTLTDGAELSTGLRKLLEAKDCMVRQRVIDLKAGTHTPDLRNNPEPELLDQLHVAMPDETREQFLSTRINEHTPPSKPAVPLGSLIDSLGGTPPLPVEPSWMDKVLAAQDSVYEGEDPDDPESQRTVAGPGPMGSR